MSACREVRNRGISVLLRILLSEDPVKPEDINTDEEDDEEDEELDDEKKTKGDNEWTAIFSEVLFPLVARLLKPEVHKADPMGMGETRVIMVTVLCKVFLKYFELLGQVPGRVVRVAASASPEQPAEDEAEKQMIERMEFVLVRAWTGTLELLDRLMNASVGTKEGEALEEAVTEGVKNVLLVLGDGGYLERPGVEGAGRDKQDDMSVQLWSETSRRLEVFLPGLMAELFPTLKEVAPASAPSEVPRKKEPEEEKV